MPRQSFLPPVFREHLLQFFFFCLLHFSKGGQSLMLAVSQIRGKHLPQEQTPLGCRIALEAQTSAGLLFQGEIAWQWSTPWTKNTICNRCIHHPFRVGTEWDSSPCPSPSRGRCNISTLMIPNVASPEKQEDFSVHSGRKEGKNEGKREGRKERQGERKKGRRDRDMKGRMDEGALFLQ